MPTYPLEAGEAEPFVPASLRDIPALANPPKLWLKWGTPRDKERMRVLLDEEGVEYHSNEALRAELLKGMEALLSTADFHTWEPLVKEWWDAFDTFQKEHADTPAEDVPPWHHDGEDLITETLEQIGRDWRPYKVMNASNNAFRRMQGHAINAVIITRYENLDVPCIKEGRYLSIDTALAIAEKLDELGRKHAPHADSRPSRELGIETLQRLFLDKEREGNSASPAPSEATPEVSTTGEA